jgi:hypothetical protein
MGCCTGTLLSVCLFENWNRRAPIEIVGISIDIAIKHHVTYENN